MRGSNAARRHRFAKGPGPGITIRSPTLLAYNHSIKFLSMCYAAAITILMLIVTIAACQIFLRWTAMFRASKA